MRRLFDVRVLEKSGLTCLSGLGSLAYVSFASVRNLACPKLFDHEKKNEKNTMRVENAQKKYFCAKAKFEFFFLESGR